MSDAPLPQRTRVGTECHNETKNLAALLILNILYHQYLHFFSLNTEPDVHSPFKLIASHG